MPKPPEIAGEAADAKPNENENDQEESRVSENEDTAASNGKGKEHTEGSIPVVSDAEQGALAKKCRRILDTQMKEIGHVFDNGM
jgi:hypothetical protein